MKRSIYGLILVLALYSGVVFSQENTSIISGTVSDKQSGYALPGASVTITSLTPKLGANTDKAGRFSIEDVPTGRHTVQISFLGYKTVTIPNVLVTVAKESTLNITLLENVESLSTVIVSSQSDKRNPINTMATTSARQFTVEEAQRYSGSLQDPARMATNFAGVSGANDARNDIVIRGNSPVGVLWRLEGVDIPSPSHFSTLGTTGGPITMLNLNNLANSDFLTGAWSADYGNAISGVFDLKLREGSVYKQQFLGQVGFNGFELGAEGPLGKKKKASYLANYRYSTPAVFKAIGLGKSFGFSIPDYQDLTFKLALPTEKLGKFTLFGLAGNSAVEFKGENEDSTNLYTDAFEDKKWSSRTAIIGASHGYFFNKNTLGKLIVSVSNTGERGQIDSLSPDYSMSYRTYGKFINQTKYTANYKINKKLNSKNTAIIGTIYSHYQFTLLDSFSNHNNFIRLTDIDGGMDLLQGYALWQHRVGELWTFNTGLHGQMLVQNKTYAIEPRLGAKYHFHENHSLNGAIGLHSQMQPMLVYFTKDPDGLVEGNTNTGLDFTKSIQFILGYDYFIKPGLRFKSEVYYQSIYNVPVESTPSSYSLLNEGTNFNFEKKINLVNQGSGENYGVEFTLEKFFTKDYYFLNTVSIFSSTYKGSDGIRHNTTFNSNYVLNTLVGKEVKINDNVYLSFDTKLTLAGGKRYTPINLDASIADDEEVVYEDRAFENQFDPYFRWDFKVSVREIGEKVTQQLSVDAQNVTNRQNVFSYDYNERANDINTTYQRGFFLDFQYKIYF